MISAVGLLKTMSYELMDELFVKMLLNIMTAAKFHLYGHINMIHHVLY